MLGYKPFSGLTVLSTECRNSHFLFAPKYRCSTAAASVVLAVQHLQGSHSHPAQSGVQVLHFIRAPPPPPIQCLNV